MRCFGEHIARMRRVRARAIDLELGQRGTMILAAKMTPAKGWCLRQWKRIGAQNCFASEGGTCI